MKIFTTIFLVCTIFIQTFSTYFIQADFFLNRSYIAKNFCVNRGKPMMHCNGKCYLSKKLKEQNQDQSPVSKTERLDAHPFFLPQLPVIKARAASVKTTFFIKNENTISSFPRSIFHPPAC